MATTQVKKNVTKPAQAAAMETKSVKKVASKPVAAKAAAATVKAVKTVAPKAAPAKKVAVVVEPAVKGSKAWVLEQATQLQTFVTEQQKQVDGFVAHAATMKKSVALANRQLQALLKVLAK